MTKEDRIIFDEYITYFHINITNGKVLFNSVKLYTEKKSAYPRTLVWMCGCVDDIFRDILLIDFLNL